MSDGYDIRQARAAAGDSRIPYAVEWWRPEDIILTEHVTAYLLTPGMPLRDTGCILCDLPAQGLPVILVTLASAVPCEAGSPHMLAITVMRHTNCVALDADSMVSIILSKCQNHALG